MIETPTATAFKLEATESADTDDLLSGDKKGPAEEDELFLVKQKPITAKIRTTIKHLRAQAGRWSRFRGLGLAVVYNFVAGLLLNLLSGILPIQPLWAIFVPVVLCRLHMTWTHIVISAPSSARWFQRIPSAKSMRNVLLPAAVRAFTNQLALYLPGSLFLAFNLDRYTQDPSSWNSADNATLKLVLAKYLMVFAVWAAISLFIVFPADVTLKRVEASMLPEENESIVPFDRTFGGKVTPALVGGTGAVSMLDAWKTFDWAARIRLLKLYVKVFIIQVTVAILFTSTIMAEMRLAMGDDFQKAVKQAHAHLTRKA